MHQRTSRLAVLALLLAVVFVGAQFHFCADVSAAPASSHLCPLCNATTSAVAAQALLLIVAPVSNRLESPGAQVLLSIDIPQAISPRAPPTCNSIH